MVAKTVGKGGRGAAQTNGSQFINQEGFRDRRSTTHSPQYWWSWGSGKDDARGDRTSSVLAVAVRTSYWDRDEHLLEEEHYFISGELRID